MSIWRKPPAYKQKRQEGVRRRAEREYFERQITAIKGISETLERSSTQEQTDDDNRSFREKVTIALLIATVFFTAAADVIFYLTMTDAHENAMKQLALLDSQLKMVAAGSAQTDTQIEITRELATAAQEQAKTSLDQAQTSRDAAQAARDNMIAMQGAWIAPTTSVLAPLVKGEGMNLTVNYVNSGHEPTVLNDVLSAQRFTRDEWSGAISRDAVSKMTSKCMSYNIVLPSQTVFPATQNSNYWISVNTTMLPEGAPPVIVDEDIISGNSVVAFTGCFVYQDNTKVRHTSYCVFYDALHKFDAGLPFCSVGGMAD